jgi:hypothetical protein
LHLQSAGRRKLSRNDLKIHENSAPSRLCASVTKIRIAATTTFVARLERRESRVIIEASRGRPRISLTLNPGYAGCPG